MIFIARWLTLIRHKFTDSILNILTTKSPSTTLMLSFLHTQDLYWHPLLIERIPFSHIYHVYADSSASTTITHSKIEPLKVSGCVSVWA